MIASPSANVDPWPPSPIAIAGDIDFWLQEVAGTLARQAPAAEVLRLLCRHVGQTVAERQVGFFVVRGGEWIRAATGNLTEEGAATWARLDPGALSNLLLEGRTTPVGWARLLLSRAGELLGMMVGLSETAEPPSRRYAARIQTVCRLAIVAIEQENLLAELAFYTDRDAVTMTLMRAHEGELLIQRAAEMITQQNPPAEILGELCRRLGQSRAERQIACFLLDGDAWRLAATGDLTPPSQEILKQLDPARLHAELLEAAPGGGHAEREFYRGWARHLCSGTGELLGMVVGFADGPSLPSGLHASRIESICRLGALAVEQQNLIAELAFNADHDAITMVCNRSAYERILRLTVRPTPQGACSPALVYAGLDRFRLVNDVMGAATGNRLLREVGSRFRSCLGEQDTLARVGGDEFAALLPDVPALDMAKAVAARLLGTLQEPFTVDGHELFVSASIGIAYAGPESTPESLDREAYLAMYQAKRSARGRSVVFHPSMTRTPPERLEMEKRLRFALARQEMLLYFQPQVELASGLVTGAEALLRWRPERIGSISPAAFIPILEETGMIIEFGRWVLGEACRQGKQIAATTGLRLRMGVNVSAAQLMRPDFISDVEGALASSGLEPALLELELTESLFVGDFEAARRCLQQLQRTGVTLALDDFGTGQASLSYLDELPFHKLKIDQSFVRRIGPGDPCPQIVRNILLMAGSCGLATIAEGIETAHQASLLRAERCDEGQGFFFARALPPEDFIQFCQRAGTAQGEGAVRQAVLGREDRIFSESEQERET